MRLVFDLESDNLLDEATKMHVFSWQDIDVPDMCGSTDDPNVGIVTIGHTNEDNEIKYCKMIGQRASVIVRLDRNKEAEDFEDRNTTTLVIEKNRPTSEEGVAGQMLFNTETFTMEQI